MTKGDLDAIQIWGRPLKPVALGLTWYMICLFIFNLFANGLLDDTLVSHIVLVMSGVSVFSLIGGWVFKSQHLAEAGLFVSGLTAVLRSAFLLAYGGGDVVGVWLGIGVAIVALGSFLLERADESAASWRL
jgi:hypothetical protein